MRKFLLSCVLGAALVAVPAIGADRAESLRETQQVLKEKGYYKGEVDGMMGPQTRQALRAYQQDNNLKPTGRWTVETAKELGVVDPVNPEHHFEEAGEEIADHYTKAGKAVTKGTKRAADDLEDAEITAGAKDFGKGIGKGAKQVGVGTKDAAVETAEGTAEAARVAADKTEDVGQAAYKKTKKGVKVAADKTEDVGEAAYKGTKKGVKVAADKTEDVGQAAYKKTKKGVKVAADKTEDVGEAVVDGTKKAAGAVVDAFDGKNTEKQQERSRTRK